MNPAVSTRPFGPPLKTRPGDPDVLAPTAMTTAGSGSALQIEPRRPKERIMRVELNSWDRDVCAYPSPADFIWVFPFPVKNVRSICIVGGTVPVPRYTIDVPYNTLSFHTGSRKVAVTIPPGAYTPATAAAALQGLLTTADGTNTYTAAINPITQRLSVTTSGTNTFGFLFGTGDYLNTFAPGLQKIANPAHLLGFVDSDAFSDASGVLVAPYPCDLGTLPRIYIHLNYDATMDLRSINRGNGRYEPSAILYTSDVDTTTNAIKTMNRDTYDNVLEPHLIIPRIRQIHVSLRDEFYNIINTNNRPVTLLLEITVFD